MTTMTVKDWLVTDDGQCQVRPAAKEWELLAEHYYFHRFLTEIVDLINLAPSETEEWDFLPQIRRLVRKLVTNSYWLQTQRVEADPKTGVGILTLYDEIGYPLTVQNVTFMPGVTSPIHNHGTWGVVAVLQGQEQHTFWQRVADDPDHPDRIIAVGQKTLNPGEIISFMPGAIHHVQAIADQPTITFQIYGDTQPRSRFEFDPIQHTAKHF
jgi:predicted metal-dependent enzyme (double-stranded beta helix superfamily)